MKKGKYIVIEGNDGTGKTTQVELLAEHFRKNGQAVQIVEEPGSDNPTNSTPVANDLRKAIKNGSLERSPEINVLLFSAARRELWQKKIAPALNKGKIVLSARNYFSTLAYQGQGEGIDSAEILRLTKLFTHERYMNPDILKVLVANHDTRKKRIAKRGALLNPDTFESRSDTFQNTVNNAYAELATKYNLPTINAGQSIEEIHKQLIETVQKPNSYLR